MSQGVAIMSKHDRKRTLIVPVFDLDESVKPLESNSEKCC